MASALSIRFGTSARGHLLAQQDDAEAGVLAIAADGSCVFFERDAGRLCRIHRALGEGLLPSACRHFPRVVLTDPRGTFITLSHFCPTAAGLLFEDAGLEMVPAPDTITLAGTAEGLDARDSLPPLLRPGMLMDFEAYGAWERNSIATLEDAAGVDAALESIASATRRIQEWSPGRGSLTAVVAQAFACRNDTSSGRDPAADAARHSLALASVPDGVAVPESVLAPLSVHPQVTTLWRALDVVVRRYLASKLFANWWPYLGLDLAGVVEAIEVHAAVLRGRLSRRLESEADSRGALLEAIRDTDMLLVHLSDPRTLARLIDVGSTFRSGA